MRFSRYYYWLVTKDETGKPYLVYGGATEEEARQAGLEMLGGADFEIKRLPTRNLATASSMLKGDRLQRYHRLKEARKRVGHDKSLSRMRRKHITQNNHF